VVCRAGVFGRYIIKETRKGLGSVHFAKGAICSSGSRGGRRLERGRAAGPANWGEGKKKMGFSWEGGEIVGEIELRCGM